MAVTRRQLMRSGLGLAIVGAGVSALAMSHAVAATRATNPSLTPDDIQDLDRVSAYLNSLTALTGAFTQIDQTGEMSEGTFYMLRPGRVRFDYKSPKDAPVLVSDGQWFSVEDRKLKSVARYPLNSTPLSLLLKADVDLASDSRVVNVERQPGMLSVTARDEKGLAQGELTMIFRDPGLELRNWIIKDAQGFYTTIAVRDLREGIKLDPALFKVKEPTGSGGRPR